ncbi:hypothetical protein CRUP_025292 [Coryphaenoides rupestris]|nr:hypothetical protein CRUP_025292 [Coryphaenoides rupestris]
MMLKMSQKIRHTSRTLKIDGMAPTRAFTTTCERDSEAGLGGVSILFLIFLFFIKWRLLHCAAS